MKRTITNTNGKIWVFLNTSIQWKILKNTKQLIPLKLCHQGSDKDFDINFVYAKCDERKRQELWDNYIS